MMERLNHAGSGAMLLPSPAGDGIVMSCWQQNYRSDLAVA
jgi:hypothetical protein